MYKNSSEAEALVNYATSATYEELAQHILEGNANNDCLVKHEAHMALCIKYALTYGCNPRQVHNCYDTDDNDEGPYSDFYLFRAHTRELTDFMDEKLSWDMLLSSITPQLINKFVYQFKRHCSRYKFRA